MRFIRWMPAVTWAIFLFNASAKTHMRYGESSGSIFIASASNHSAFLANGGYDSISSSADSGELAAARFNESPSKAINEGQGFRTHLVNPVMSWYHRCDTGSFSHINLLLIFPFHFFW